jgi:hypothetical protein
MKKVVLFILALCAVTYSCRKTPKVPLSYSVETVHNKPLETVYIPDAGSYTMSVLVKYLGGFHEDPVTISIKGLPADIAVVEDTFTLVPTYQADFVFKTTNAVHATYPITLTTSALGSEPKTYNFDLTVVSADCAANLWGNFAGTNACTARNFTYTAVGSSTGVTNELNVTNLGGYGSTTTTRIILDCNKDSLRIPEQYIGNGTNLSGVGTFTANSMTILYTASTTPGGFAETCSVTLTKQ